MLTCSAFAFVFFRFAFLLPSTFPCAPLIHLLDTAPTSTNITNPPRRVATLLLSQDEVRLLCNFQCRFGRCRFPSASGHLRPSRREKSAVSFHSRLVLIVVVRVIKKTIVPNHCIALLAHASLACYKALGGRVRLPDIRMHAYVFFMMGGIFGCAETNFANEVSYIVMRRISRCDQKENHSVSRHVP